MEVYVTGIGVVSAIGQTVSENLNGLQGGTTGIRWSEEHQLLLGSVDLSNAEIMRRFQLPEEDFSRTSLLGLVAAAECWGNNQNPGNVRTGLIAATSAGGLDRMEQYYFRAKAAPEFQMNTFMTHDNGRSTDRMARVLGISGYIGTISTACSSGANAIMQGARLIQADRADRMLVGGSDPLTIFNMKGFGSLMVYDQELCRPFDAERKGLNLGEGAAFLLLENEKSLAQTGNTPICLLSGWHNATDAYHQTASSPTGIGATLTMQGALARAGIKPEQVSYINAHGTGTGNNDLSESVAINNVFGSAPPPFSSTKAFTGHTLAAAGAIEAVYGVLAIRHGIIPPNLHFKTVMPETGLVPQTELRSNTLVKYVLSNSFGFGGNCTSLVFSQLP